LITEGEKMMGQEMDPKVKDAAIIGAAQKIEHYEISGYGTARTYARELGLNEVANLLETTLNEEYKADDSLTSLAINRINLDAEAGGSPTRTKQKDTKMKQINGTGVRNGITKSSKNNSGKKTAKAKGNKKTAVKKSAPKGKTTSKKRKTSSK
jgi:hypothetical protein